MAVESEEAEVGKRIRLMRKEHGISQRLAAEQMLLSRDQLNRIERGEVAVRLHSGVAFCEFAETNPLWLAFGEPEKPFGCPDEEYMDGVFMLDATLRESVEPTFLAFMKRNKERFRRVSPLYAFDRESPLAKKRLGRVSIKHYLIPEMSAEAPATWSKLRSLLASKTESAEAKKKLAKRLGVTPAAISQWRSGANAPSADNALRILEWVREVEAKQQPSAASVSDARLQRKARVRRS